MNSNLHVDNPDLQRLARHVFDFVDRYPDGLIVIQSLLQVIEKDGLPHAQRGHTACFDSMHERGGHSLH
jgi:hypothetical protein